MKNCESVRNALDFWKHNFRRISFYWSLGINHFHRLRTIRWLIPDKRSHIKNSFIDFLTPLDPQISLCVTPYTINAMQSFRRLCGFVLLRLWFCTKCNNSIELFDNFEPYLADFDYYGLHAQQIYCVQTAYVHQVSVGSTSSANHQSPANCLTGWR